MKESTHLQSMRKRLALLLEEIAVISDNQDRHEMESHAETLRGDIKREECWEHKQDAIRTTTELQRAED